MNKPFVFTPINVAGLIVFDVSLIFGLLAALCSPNPEGLMYLGAVVALSCYMAIRL